MRVPVTLTEAVIVALIGLAAGVVGGLAGIGGSIIMLPALAILLGREDGTRQHAFAAAAMIVNLLVAAPATRVHKKRGTIKKPIVVPLLIAGLPAIVIGVLVSNQTDGVTLRKILAVLIGAYALYSIVKALGFGPPDHPDHVSSRGKSLGLGAIGGFTGFCAGLLGIGGGAIMVPAMQAFVRVPLKQAVSASATVMVITSIIGATLKTVTVTQHGRTIGEVLILAGLLGPLAIVGSGFGAKMTHALPIRIVRVLIGVTLAASAAKMAGLF